MITNKTITLTVAELLDLASKALKIQVTAVQITKIGSEPILLRQMHDMADIVFVEEIKTGPHKPKEGH